MFIHQEETKDCIESWIELEKISFIRAMKYNNKIEYYKLYLVGDDAPVSISQETFDKIIAERGVI